MLSPDDDELDDNDDDYYYYGKDPRMMQCVLYPVVKLQYSTQNKGWYLTNPTNYKSRIDCQISVQITATYVQGTRQVKTASCL